VQLLVRLWSLCLNSGINRSETLLDVRRESLDEVLAEMRTLLVDRESELFNKRPKPTERDQAYYEDRCFSFEG
jgi:hypothetical protein